MKLCIFLLLIVGAWVAPIDAQTTQPAPAAWQQTAQTIAASLASGQECRSLLANDCAIRAFDGPSSRQLADVCAHTSGATLLLAKAYTFPGGAIAADIGAAVQGSGASDDIKHLLVPAEGDPTTKANTTATRWVQNALAPASGDPVAVLVYLTANSDQTADSDGQILFVLLKARADSDDHYSINQIVYGDTQQAAVTSAPSAR